MPTPSEAKILRQFGANLRMEREKVGISQETLADTAHLDRTYVGSVERGERNVSLINIVKLARALGIQAGQLFKTL